MVQRAASMGAFDRPLPPPEPPEGTLTRTYLLIARGIVETLQDPLSTIITVIYGPGQPAVPVGLAGPVSGLDGLDGERFWPLVQNSAGHLGPFSMPFFFGLGGVVEYFKDNVQMTDILVPTGNGVGNLAAGGLLFNADNCFDNMAQEAADEEIMVTRVGVHVSEDPLDFIRDPTTQDKLFAGDLFKQSEILLQAIAAQLAVELLLATKTAIPVTGLFVPIVPPITAPTVTSILF